MRNAGLLTYIYVHTVAIINSMSSIVTKQLILYNTEYTAANA